MSSNKYSPAPAQLNLKRTKLLNFRSSHTAGRSRFKPQVVSNKSSYNHLVGPRGSTDTTPPSSPRHHAQALHGMRLPRQPERGKAAARGGVQLQVRREWQAALLGRCGRMWDLEAGNAGIWENPGMEKRMKVVLFHLKPSVILIYIYIYIYMGACLQTKVVG